MSWWKRKLIASPAQVAADLYEIFVDEAVTIDMSKPDLFLLSGQRVESLSKKIREFRIAAILYTLLEAAQRKRKFEAVLRAYEAIVFPPQPTDAGLAYMNHLKVAMKELDALRRSPDPLLSWAQSWLAEAGQIEDSPFALTAVCIHWLGVLNGVRAAIGKLAVR